MIENKDIKPLEKRRKPYIQIVCQFCEITFELPPNIYKLRSMTQKNIFCSKACSQKNRIGKPNDVVYTKELKEKLSIAQRSKTLSQKALEKMKKLGKESKNLFKKGHKIHDIYPELRKKILTTQRKEKHWNWKGGFYKQIFALRGTQKYINWRTSVFIRDNHTCQECNVRNKNINAHHIIPFAKLFYDKDETTMWDINNGITLCQKCHNLKHTGVKKEIYAKKN